MTATDVAARGLGMRLLAIAMLHWYYMLCTWMTMLADSFGICVHLSMLVRADVVGWNVLSKLSQQCCASGMFWTEGDLTSGLCAPYFMSSATCTIIVLWHLRQFHMIVTAWAYATIL